MRSRSWEPKTLSQQRRKPHTNLETGKTAQKQLRSFCCRNLNVLRPLLLAFGVPWPWQESSTSSQWGAGSREMNRTIAIALAWLMVAPSVGACFKTTRNFRAVNREAVNQLTIGMSKEEALAVMGTSSTWVCDVGITWCYLVPLAWERVTNPHRTETARTADGTVVEIAFYQTDTRKADRATTDDELTPLVFEKGQLAGWGWSFLEQNVKRYEIRIR